MTYIVSPKNKKEERVLEALFKSLSIRFYSEEKEDAAIIKAMKKGRRSKLLTSTQKKAFLKKLKSTK